MEFSDSKFMTAEEKTKVYNALVRFLDSGLQRQKFTKALYQYLSLNFGFIAHFNIEGFYSERFADAHGRAKTLEMIVNASHWSFDNDPDRVGDLNRAVRALFEENAEKLLHSARDQRITQLLLARGQIDRELRLFGVDPNTGKPLTAETAEAIDVDSLPPSPKRLGNG